MHCSCMSRLLHGAQHKHAVQVREEQMQIRGSAQAPVTGDNVGQMTYTRQVVREVLRFRPPAPMVPQVDPRIRLTR